ncbi:LytR/AlgR family response regulator transcription factor [Fusibacter sp. JL298sf-3]
MYKILICDDNPYDLQFLYDKVAAYAIQAKLQVEILKYQDPERMLFNCESQWATYDIVLLDVVFSSTTGIDIAKMIKRVNPMMNIIFVSYTKAYVFDALDVFPTHYILKEKLYEDKLFEVLDRTFRTIEHRKNRMFIAKMGEETRVIEIQKILYFEVYKRRVSVKTDDGHVFTFYHTLEKVADELADAGFVRCHRSTLVNLSKIIKITSGTVVLSNGEALAVGRKFKPHIKEALDRFFGQEASARFQR